MENNRLYNNIIIFLFVAILIAPAPGILFGGLSMRLIDLVILFLSLLFLFVILLKNKERSFKDWTITFLKDKIILFIVLSSVSVVISTIVGTMLFPEYTGIFDIYELYRYAFYFSLYILVAYFLTDIEKFFKVSMITVIGIQLFGIFQFLNIFNINHNFGLLYTKSERHHMMIEAQHRIGSTLANPNVYGSFLIIGLCFLLALLYLKKEKDTMLKWLIYILIPLTIFSVFLTTSRTTVIITLGLLVYSFLFHAIVRFTSIKDVLLKTAYPVIAYLCVSFILVPQIPYLNSAFSSISDTLHAALEESSADTDEDPMDEKPIDQKKKSSVVKESLETVDSFKNRYYYWDVNMVIFKQSPIVGAGPMKDGLSFADNAYIYILARYGAIGFLLYVLFFGYAYFKTFAIAFKKDESSSTKIIASTVNLTIVGFAVMGMVSEVWFNIESMIVLFVLIGLLKNKRVKKYHLGN